MLPSVFGLRRGSLGFVLLLLAAACNQSQIDPGADVLVTGAVAAQDGEPMAGARVALMKEPDAGDVFVGVVSIGLSCLEYEFSECGETRLQTTDPDGTFSFELKGSDTQGRFGNASILELTTSLPRTGAELAGPGVSTRFQVQSEQASIPLRIWGPILSVTGEGATVKASFDDPPGALFPSEADLGDMRRWVVFEARPDETVWRADAKRGGVSFDARLLEDSSGGVSAFATIGDIETTPEAGTDVEVLLRSSKLAYESRAGAPPSRSMLCAFGSDVPDSACRLTDGRYDREAEPPGDVQSTTATVDLGEQIDVTLVAVRGCSGPCTVEGSTDGESFSRLGSGGDELGPHDFAIKPKSVAARYVRVTADGGASTLREVSVWDETASVSGSLLVAPETVSRDLVPDGGGGGRSGTARLIVILAIVAAVVAIAVVFLVRRRSKAAR